MSHTEIPGLVYISNFITKDEEKELLKTIREQEWLGDLKRRVQHYGYKYDYRKRKIDESMALGPLPPFLEELATRLMDEDIINEKPDQAIINEYKPGQGISRHIDKVSLFKEEIVSLSLGSNYNMVFQKGRDLKEVRLRRRSLVVMKDDARYKYTHYIPSRLTDEWNGKKYKRGTRISITFRKVKI